MPPPSTSDTDAFTALGSVGPGALEKEPPVTYVDVSKGRSVALAASAVVLVLAAGGGGAMAASLITSADIKDKTIKKVDLAKNAVETQKVKDGSLKLADLNKKANDAIATGVGPQGPQGPKGDKGDSGVTGAYFSVAFYNAGDTNAGAIATVACKAQTDTAISGGVQVLGLDADANSRNTPVSSSFPGRMDYAATPPSPRPNRLDGWIVQFGGNAGAVSDKDPEKVKVWALCVPNTPIPVVRTYTQQPE